MTIFFDEPTSTTILFVFKTAFFAAVTPVVLHTDVTIAAIRIHDKAFFILFALM